MNLNALKSSDLREEGARIAGEAHSAPDTPHPALLEPELLRKLERLALISRRAFVGRTMGERRSTKRGSSVEFADYRDYSPGDDFRRIDWNAYARLDRLFLKLFTEEEDLAVHLLLDASRSMEFGAPSKWNYGRRTAAALAYMALFHHDRVSVGLFGERLAACQPPTRGRGRASHVMEWLSRAELQSGTDVGRSLKEYAGRLAAPGVAVVLSDFFSPGWEAGLRALADRRCEVTVLHLLDDAEVSPRLEGDLRLVDAETCGSTKRPWEPSAARFNPSATGTAWPTSASPPPTPSMTCCSATSDRPDSLGDRVIGC
jgi:uncharacterized protein (DUF58 family)